MPKKTTEIIKRPITCIGNQPSITFIYMVNEIEHVFGVRVCLNTIRNWLDGTLMSVRLIIENVNISKNKIKHPTYLRKKCLLSKPMSGHLSG